jgi:hypothetical protein
MEARQIGIEGGFPFEIPVDSDIHSCVLCNKTRVRVRRGAFLGRFGQFTAGDEDVLACMLEGAQILEKEESPESM